MDHQRYPPYHPSLAGSGRYGEEHVEGGRATERASRLRPVDLRNNPDASNNNRWYYAATNSSSTHHPRFCGPSEADGAAFPVFPAAASEDDDRSHGHGTDSTDGNPFPPPPVLGSSRTRHRKQRCSSESVACSLPPRSRGYEAASNAYRESTAPYYDRYSSDSSIWAREASRESVGNSSSERTTPRVVDPPTKIPLSSSSSWASGVALRSVSSPSGEETSAGRLSRHREEEGAESCRDHYSIRSVPRKRARLDEALEGCGGETSSNNHLIGRSFPEKTAIGDQTHSVCEDFPSSYKIRGSYTKPESSYHKTSVGIWQNSSSDVRGPRDFVSLPENAVLKEMQTRSDNFPIDLDANDTRDLGRGDYQQSHRTHLLLAGRAFVSYPEGVPEISAATCRNSQPTDVPFPAQVSSSRDATESFHRVANRSLPIRRSSSPFEDSCGAAACKKPSMAEEPYASRRSCSGNHPDYALDSSSLKYKMLQDERMLSGESSLINSPNLDENVNTSVSTSVTVPSLGSFSGFGCRTDKMCKDYEILDKASSKNYSILSSCAEYEIVEHPRGVELKSHKGTKSMCASTSTRETDVAANHRTSKSNYRNTHLKSHRDKTRSPSSPKQSGIGAPHGVTRRRRRRAIGLVCGVCGDTARSLHFGGISCDSCKAFFRRAIIAKAYPSFLCVTTGLPLRIKQQTKEEAKYTNDKTEGRLGARTNFSNDLSTFESTSTPYNMQETPKVSLSTPLFQDVDAHKLGSDHQNVNQNLESTNICSVSKSSLPKTVSKESESANSSSVCAVSVDVIGKLAFTSNKSSVCDVPKSARDGDASISSGALVVKNKEALLHSSEATLRSGCVGTLSRCPPITITTRKYCQACRFQQCIDIGMEISWVTLENDAQRKMVDQAIKGGDTGGDDSRDYSIANKEESFSKTKEFSDAGLNDDLDANDDCGPNKYLTKDEQRQIEDLVDIYRSVFWGVPEPVYHRPALIDFPPAFLNESLHANKNSCSQSTSHISTSESNAQHEIAQASEEYCLANDLPKAPCPSESPTKSESDRQTNEDEIPLSEMTMDDIRSLPRDPCGVNMFRKALGRRPRPWLIRQLMGYTLRFMYVVVKLLQSVGRSLSTTDRTVLLRQGMTGLTFLNSVFTYDTTVEAWPERIFPPLPLVLQGDEIRSSSDQPDYLQGTPMHTDEVATVVAPHVLEHQLTFIRGMKTLVGTDYPSMFLLMAIMLFDPTQRGLQQPQVVECIQANYCHLLKQYVSWKFQNGLPPNPGDGRPGNFAHTCATSSHKPSNKPEGSAHSNLVSTSDLGGDSISSTIPKDSLLSWEEMARNYKGDPSDILKDSYYNSTNPCCYERHEGTYFSPPYPPSPIHPKSIFPLLLTRLSDLQQTAYGYSSTPFLLQGTEVDEIGNLVARIEVFMSDLITSGFKSPNKDKDGNGGTGSGNAGVSGSNAENKEGKTKKREVNDKSAKGNEENNQPSNANRFEQSPKNARDCQSIPKSDEDYQRLSNRFGMNWITSSEDQELSQESCSSRGDDSFSGSSLSVMSIGSSIDDIVEALVSEEDGIMNVGREYEGKELAHSLGIWEMEKGSQEMQDTLTVDRTMTRKVNNASETSRLCKSDSYRETVSEGLNVEHPPSHLATNFVLGDSHHGWMREQNPCDLSLEHVHQELNKDGSLFTPQNYCINKREITFSRSGNLEIYVDGSVKRNPYHASIGRTSEFQNRTSFSCESQDTSNYPSNAERSHEGSNRVSLWDRIKATGRALLRLDSSTQLPGSWKPGINPSQTGVLLEDRRDHGNILEEQIERPESNSSGYVSTLSSPPPQMTVISDNGEFDPFGCASDWDDILQI